MTIKLKAILIALFGSASAVMAALFTGTLDPVLRDFGIEIAGHPLPGGATDVAADPKAVTAPPGLKSGEVAERVVPIFDLVRVEPTGDAVIAGQGVPDSAVEILSGGDVIASGRSNATGEWAIVLADPLRAGAHDLTVRTTPSSGGALVSEQSVAVSVPEDGKGEVLVVLNRPGEAATVLQIPGLDDAAKAIAEAGGDPATAPIEVAQAGDGAAPSAAPTTEPAAEPTPSPTAAPTAAPTVAPTAAPTAVPTATPTPTAAATPAPTPGEPPAASPATPSAPAGAPADAASATPPSDPDAPAPAGVDAALSNPFAATGPSPAAEAPSAPTAAAETLAPTAAAAAPTPDAKSDLPDAASAAAGTTPIPSPSAAPAAASTEPPAAAPTAGAEAPAVDLPAIGAATPTPTAVPTPTPAPSPVTVEAVELENGNKLYVAGAAGRGAAIRLYVDGTVVADTTAMETGRWLVEETFSVAPGSHTVRADHLASDGRVVSRAEVPFTVADVALSPPTAVAGSGDAAAGTGIAGEARVGESETLIIRRGDNLWHIARRLYGRGIRYSTIYQANTDQIRNPDLIYPGQVFVIPKGDTSWTEAPSQ